MRNTPNSSYSATEKEKIFCAVLLGYFCIAYANVSNPTVPSHRLLGKSPEYVDTYSDAYKRAIKNRRVKMAGIGWSVSLVATLWSLFMD
ncbi:hypothetical protein F4Z99_16610 [Candidatus Poribacteria bacterium]|nr:hypothetical protein [Candidatus Poribacteria bacterium]MYB00517.1 hypothetical protein [Candidatus Poribacteria bacterium]